MPGSIWTYFEKNIVTKKGQCNICKSLFSYKSSTGNLTAHLKSKHISAYAELKNIASEGPAASQNTSPSVVPSTSVHSDHDVAVASPAQNPAVPSFPPAKRQKQMDAYIQKKKKSAEQKKMIDADVMDLFIDAFHPFSLVEERSFRKFARWIPGYNLPTRKTVSNSMLLEIFHKTKINIQTKVAIEAETICITTDLWTSTSTDSYMAITGHYINKDLEIQTVLLDCCKFFGHLK